jgi:hypothetical protein
MGAAASAACLAHMDRPVIEHHDNGLGFEARLGSRRAMKSALRLVGEVVTVSLRPT